MNVEVFDPWINPDEAYDEYGISLAVDLKYHHYDAVIMAVAHDEFKSMSISDIRKYTKLESVIYDLKYILPKDSSDIRL